ncbi:MAG: hypothetical protein OXU20_32710 [Myxococcales bacterium]|nr:hypothetical protein [Myxococcales bacterium]
MIRASPVTIVSNVIDHRIYRALFAAGALLLVAHGALWGWVLGTQTPAAEPPNTEHQAATNGVDRIYYRVTTAEGAKHVIDVSKFDAAQALLIATARYGDGATLSRIEPGEAARAATHEASAMAALGVPELVWLGAILMVSVWFVAAGSAVRTRFLRLDAVLSRLTPRLGYNARRLMEETGVADKELRSTLETINARLGTEFVWDRRYGEVVDARLSHFALVLRYCPRCNTPTAARIRADMLDVPSCTSCMAPFQGQELEHQHAQIVERLLSEDPTQGRSPKSSRFSLAVFALWVALLPPAAVVYAQGSARRLT